MAPCGSAPAALVRPCWCHLARWPAVQCRTSLRAAAAAAAAPVRVGPGGALQPWWAGVPLLWIRGLCMVLFVLFCALCVPQSTCVPCTWPPPYGGCAPAVAPGLRPPAGGHATADAEAAPGPPAPGRAPAALAREPPAAPLSPRLSPATGAVRMPPEANRCRLAGVRPAREGGPWPDGWAHRVTAQALCRRLDSGRLGPGSPV